MMIIHRDRNKRKKKIFAIIAVVLLAYGVLFSPLSSFFSNAAHTVATPVWKAGGLVGNVFRPFSGYFSSRTELSRENEDLKEQVTVMNAKLADRSFLREENDELKKLLGREDAGGRVLGIVLAKPDQTPYDTLVIDLGSGHGVARGDKVFLKSVLIGEVSDVFYNSSNVTLYSAPDSTLSVMVGDDGIVADAKGLGGGNFEIMLPRDSNVSIGDPVYVPGIEPAILGVVQEIEMEQSDAFETVLFKSHVNPFTLRYVEVAL